METFSDGMMAMLSGGAILYGLLFLVYTIALFSKIWRG